MGWIFYYNVIIIKDTAKQQDLCLYSASHKYYTITYLRFIDLYSFTIRILDFVR